MRNHYTIKVDWVRATTQILLAMAFSIMFFPGGLEFITPGLFFAIDKLKIPVAFVLLAAAIVFRKKNRLLVPRSVVIIALLYAYVTAVSFSRDVNWRIVIKEFLLVAPILLLLCTNQKDSLKILSPLLFALEWQIYLNLVTIFLFPGGMYQEELSGNVSNWLLGYDNSWNYVFFPALFIGITCKYLSGNRMRFWLLLLAMEFQSFYRWSIMCSFGFVVFDLLYLLRFYKGKIFNIRNYLIMATVAMIAILLYRNNLSFLAPIGSLIGKDLYSMSNRTRIWERAIDFVRDRPVFGYGRIAALDVARFYYFNRDAVHAHNMPLELLFRGGIIMLVLYIIGVAFSVKKLLRFRGEEYVQVLSIAYLSVFLMMITQVYLSPLSILMILLGSFSPQFIQEMHERSAHREEKKNGYRVNLARQKM